MAQLPDHVLLNRESWTRANARYTGSRARANWAAREITWGVFAVPEAELHALPDFRGLDVIELGCGTAFFGAWLKRDGARRVVGVDVTPAQLATAHACDAEFGLGLEFVEASAEEVPLESEQFDLALSEYGASIWCDPALWIAEASRLLRPGGTLLFMRNSTLQTLCNDESGKTQTSLQRPQRGIERIAWQEEDDAGVEFHPGTGDMLRLLRRNGFEVEDLIEVFAPAAAQDHPYYDYVPAEWARQWPAEEIWRARKRQPGAPP
jgi:SAM-dependent methyltransferase